MKIKRYIKKSNYSFSFGAFPTIELLTYKLDSVLRVYYSPDAINSKMFSTIAKMCSENEVKFIESNNTVSKLSPKENVYFIGVFKKFDSRILSGENHLLLYQPSDTGNLGTILRTCLGFGMNNIGIINPGVDIFYPNVVRSSMGALFRLNFEYFENVEAYVRRFKNKLYLFDIKGVKYLHELNSITKDAQKAQSKIQA